MSRICQLTGKASMKGNKVSHSNVKTIRRFEANLQTKKFYIPEVDKWITIKVSAHALRSINKMGLYEFIKKQNSKGYETGIRL
jgi:large subunit ribosomal protein L28